MLPDVGRASEFIAAGYAFDLAGVPVVLPASIFMEYVATVQVQPLPRSSERVVGLIQRRGSIVPVFDPSSQRGARALAKPVSVLVIGEGSNAAGVLIDGQPQLLASIQTEPKEYLPEMHDCVFTEALVQVCRTADSDQHQGWLLDSEILFLSLSKSAYSS